MTPAERETERGESRSGVFPTTHWSVVLAAGQGGSAQATEALETLCRAYWYPLYSYVRRRGYGAEDAQDLTQEFFCRFLAKQRLTLADPSRGRFRWFLLTSLQHFLVNEWARLQAAKRGGARPVLSLEAAAAEHRYQLEPADHLTPEKAFDRRWAVTLLERVLERLRQEAEARGGAATFESLKDCLWGEKGGRTYTEIGQRLGLSEGAVKVAVHRLRQRYEALLRAEIAQTVTTPAEVEAEIGDLFAAFE